MAWFNSLHDLEGDVKKGVVGAGHAIGTVASNPFVDVGIGALFGPGIAAAAGGLGRLMAPGGNIRGGLTGAAEGGALGYSGQALSGLAGFGSGAASGAPGAASAAGSVAPDMETAGQVGASANPGVMSRIMGDAGNALTKAGTFAKNNHELLTTAGSAASGLLSAQAQNRQGNIAQQQADAETAQIQAAIDKQKAIQAAFQHMYGQTIGNATPPARTVTPTGYQSAPPSTSTAPASPSTAANAANATDPSAALTALLKRLGYQPPPADPYAGNASQYGSPFGSGYSSGYGSGGY